MEKDGYAGASCGSSSPTESTDRQLRQERNRIEQLEFDRQLANQLHAAAYRWNEAHSRFPEDVELEKFVADARSVADRLLRLTARAVSGRRGY